MPVTRTYRCGTEACGHVFKHFHSRMDEPYPPCPQCGDDPNWVPTSFNTTTVKSKAIDIATDMMADYGLSDMADNTRPGDIAAKGPAPVQTAERDQMMQSLSEMSQQTQAQAQAAQERGVGWTWQGGGGSGTPAGPSGPAAVARAMDADPIGKLHQGLKELGPSALTGEIVGAADSSGNINPKAAGRSIPM